MPAVEKLSDLKLPAQFTDATGRALLVTHCRPGAQDGREVVGRIRHPPGTDERPYATDARIFRRVWVDKKPRWRWEGEHHG